MAADNITEAHTTITRTNTPLLITIWYLQSLFFLHSCILRHSQKKKAACDLKRLPKIVFYVSKHCDMVCKSYFPGGQPAVAAPPNSCRGREAVYCGWRLHRMVVLRPKTPASDTWRKFAGGAAAGRRSTNWCRYRHGQLQKRKREEKWA